MGRKRKTIPFNRKAHGDRFLDCVTLGKTKPYYVPQFGIDQDTGREWSDYAEVIASRVVNRDPRVFDEQSQLVRALADAARPKIIAIPQGQRWCSRCGEWLSVDRFSPKKDTADKLHSYCKACRNEHARRMYWLNKQGYTRAA